MARQRRGGGFRPPEIRGTLGTLLRTTLEQAGVVRDALERSARSGRTRLDEALSGRRRKDALAELGELVLDLIRRGEIDLGELPEAKELVRHLDDLDAGGAGGSDDDGAGAADDDPRARIAQPPLRRRFDARSGDEDRDGRDDHHGRHDHHEHHDRDRGDGTVSSLAGAARRPLPSKPASPPRVWRPTAEDAPPAPSPSEPRRATALPRDPHRKGGIQFDDDDLADYMHPDDVPPKPPSDGDR